MFTKIYNFITGEIRSVESIVANFASTVVSLERHAAAKLEEAFNHNKIVVEATADAAAAEAEAAKATAVAKNISKIIGSAV